MRDIFSNRRLKDFHIKKRSLSLNRDHATTLGPLPNFRIQISIQFWNYFKIGIEDTLFKPSNLISKCKSKSYNFAVLKKQPTNQSLCVMKLRFYLHTYSYIAQYFKDIRYFWIFKDTMVRPNGIIQVKGLENILIELFLENYMTPSQNMQR